MTLALGLGFSSCIFTSLSFCICILLVPSYYTAGGRVGSDLLSLCWKGRQAWLVL